MSDSTGGVGGAGAGSGANVHGSNDTHDTRGTGDAGPGGTSTAGTAQASAPDTGTAASAQASEDGARAHPEDHYTSEAPNPTGPTPSQVGTLAQANVSTPMSMQAQMSAISQTTAAVQKAAESAAAIGFSPSPETAPAKSAFSIANSPATTDGRPKVDPKTVIGTLGPAFSQTVEADKPSVAITVKNAGMLAAGDGVTFSAVLHDAAAPKKTGVPSLDVGVAYDSVMTATVPDGVAKPTQVPGVHLGLGLTAVGTPKMAVNADAVLKGVGWSAEMKAGYNFQAKTVALDAKLSVKPVDVYVHQDWTAKGESNTTIGAQVNFTDSLWGKVEARNKAGVSSVYTGFGLDIRF